MESLVDSLLVFGRASLGASIGLAVGWPTQGERHAHYVVALALGGFLLGCLAMMPDWMAAAAAIVLLIPSSIIWFAGMVAGALTLGDREDWWIRSWGFAAFILGYQGLAIVAATLVNRMQS